MTFLVGGGGDVSLLCLSCVEIYGPVCDLVGKVVRIARNPWITQEMISEMDECEQRKREENFRRLKNELKRITDKAEKES